MKYKVTVCEVTPLPPDDRGYSRDKEEKIYEQVVDALDIRAVITAVNQESTLTKATRDDRT